MSFGGASVFSVYMAVLRVTEPCDPSRIEELCRQAEALLEHDCELICDVEAVARPSAETIDALARLQLTVTRSGRTMRISGACDRLRELIVLMGLHDVLAVEPSGQAE